MSELWKYEELSAMKERFIESEFKDEWFIGEFRFLPLVTKRNKQVAQLHIFILWPDAPGTIVSNKGDIDNRLKTLLDALRIPQGKNDIPAGDKPMEDEDPFFSLLEDDKLISKIAINTAHLLVPSNSDNDVKLFVNVKIKNAMMFFEGHSFATDY